ncbi:hypothetical protein C8R44DRAFT_983573 [Mycena epipterygia]|nr:hypothetical protein C8R44DRAFT_983573 [Mycena epipterygia]
MHARFLRLLRESHFIIYEELPRNHIAIQVVSPDNLKLNALDVLGDGDLTPFRVRDALVN